MDALFTQTDYDRLPEGFPAQLIDGMLVRDPSPTYGHQDLQMRLLRLLIPLVEPGLLVASPADVLIDEHNVFQPDIVVLGAIPPRDSHYVGTPRVAFEIFSPSTVARDRDQKTPRLLELGVQEVWLIDPRAGTIECWTQTGTRTAVGDQAIHSGVIPGFSLHGDDVV